MLRGVCKTGEIFSTIVSFGAVAIAMLIDLAGRVVTDGLIQGLLFYIPFSLSFLISLGNCRKKIREESESWSSGLKCPVEVYFAFEIEGFWLLASVLILLAINGLPIGGGWPLVMAVCSVLIVSLLCACILTYVIECLIAKCQKRQMTYSRNLFIEYAFSFIHAKAIVFTSTTFLGLILEWNDAQEAFLTYFGACACMLDVLVEGGAAVKRIKNVKIDS